jgi:hypothetical protein
MNGDDIDGCGGFIDIEPHCRRWLLVFAEITLFWYTCAY